MDLLTDEQRRKLKYNRKAIIYAVDDIASVERLLSKVCDHENNDDECPVCHLYKMIEQALNAAQDLPIKLDEYLENN